MAEQLTDKLLADLERETRAIAIAIETRDLAVIDCHQNGVPITRIAAAAGLGRPAIYRIIERMADDGGH
jgi:predicted transcriptional regulator